MNRRASIWHVGAHWVSVAVALLVTVQSARAQAVQAPGAEGEDHRAVLEFGFAGERGIGQSSTSIGGTIAVEMTPIENWLELEAGVAALRGAGHTEYSADFLIKKPWQLSRKFEFMAGFGPELSHAVAHNSANTLATEVIGDFMYWPTKNVGWYAEPGYTFTRLSGGDRSFELSAGLIVGIP